jgi:hypothetical protein
MGPTFLYKKKPLLVPEPEQRVRLRARRGLWRGNFRAVSKPYTDESGEVVIRVAREGEYWEANREGRRAVGMPWPVRQMEVGSSLRENNGETTQELPQRPDPAPERTERRSSTGGPQNGSERVSWWRMMFGP